MDEADESEPAAAVDRGDGETVLVIDDEPTVRMLIVEVLEENGYSAIEDLRRTGPRARCFPCAMFCPTVRRAMSTSWISDHPGLPGGLNGRQIADAARQTRPNLKVLFITGYAENAAVVASGRSTPAWRSPRPTVHVAIATLGAEIRELIDR